ncbi:hypothetical protein MMC28_000912 [Mycoblastus sanguinarius]|nr:hypothetical protein [Mycoblastus sanguinarius]
MPPKTAEYALATEQIERHLQEHAVEHPRKRLGKTPAQRPEKRSEKGPEKLPANHPEKIQSLQSPRMLARLATHMQEERYKENFLLFPFHLLLAAIAGLFGSYLWACFTLIVAETISVPAPEVSNDVVEEKASGPYTSTCATTMTPSTHYAGTDVVTTTKAARRTTRAEPLPVTPIKRAERDSIWDRLGNL